MEALFLRLLGNSLEAGVVVGIVWMMRLVFRNVPKWLHCLMWGLVAFKLLCPVSVESQWSLMPSGDIFSVPHRAAQAQETEQRTAHPAAFGSGNAAPESVPDSGTAVLADQAASDGLSDASGSGLPHESLAAAPLSAGMAAAYVWLAGAAVLGMYAIGSYASLRRRLADAVPVTGNIYRSDRVSSAFVFGLCRPRIYLPYGMSEENERQVVAHEAAHLCRRDHLTKALAFALAAVYWFHPLMWLAYGLYCRDMEQACDERVIRDKSAEERKAYSRALLACAVEQNRFRIEMAVPVGFGEHDVKRRVANVLKHKKPAVGLIVAALAVVAIAAVLFLTKPKSYSVEVPEALDHAIAATIFAEENVSMTDLLFQDKQYYYAAISDFAGRSDCECYGEGHIVLGVNESENAATVYALCSAAGYGFMNGNLVAKTGYSGVPTVIEFAIDKDGRYIYKSRQEAEDGAYFRESIEKLFPKSIVAAYDKLTNDKINKTADLAIATGKKLSDQCDKYAEAYLKKIGREAKVGDYIDFDFKLLSDYGVSSEVSNALMDLHSEYDIYVGNFETIESGARYVYAQIWDGDHNGNGVVTFMKYPYPNGEVIEKYSYKVEKNRFTKIKDE